MSKAINSPTGRLLRSSRLFSLPPPLPAAPTQDSMATRSIRFSDTATAPYPTHQAIFTPASSRSRGDWGLKRPLPSRAIPSQTPHLRIKAIDTLHHITDFESAADHTQSLLKWQHMNIPMSIHAPRNTVSQRDSVFTSAFLDQVDNTTLNKAGNQDSASTTQRALDNQSAKTKATTWKSNGPWVAGMSEDEFQRYLFNAVRQHKGEFREYLAAVKVRENRANLERRMRDSGELQGADPRTIDLELAQKSKLTKYELDDWIKTLRDGCQNLNSPLSKHIRQFFDMPAFTPPQENQTQRDQFADNFLKTATSAAGPLSTHPSAGLSYLLTPAVVNNHPLYGPQSERDPVEARVLRTRQGIRNYADLGVGGFVTHSESSLNNMSNRGFNPHNNNNNTASNRGPLDSLDLSLQGGNKFWVTPRSASIDERGRVRLTVSKSSPESVGIKTGNPVIPSKVEPTTDSTRMSMPLDGYARPFGANFGNALSNQNLPSPDDVARSVGSGRIQRELSRRSVEELDSLIPKQPGYVGRRG